MAKLKTHKNRAADILKELGWQVDDVERVIRNGRMTRRFDLYGFADLLCVKGEHTLAVQVCALRPGGGGDLAAHQTKMLAEPRLASCLKARWFVELWGIRRTPRGDGQTVSIRSFELTDDGTAYIVFEGSDVTLVED